jgi:hypothetical protein
MATTRCDSKGRLYLRKKTREMYGTEFVIVEAPNEIVLIPVPADPLKELAELGKPLERFSLEEIKRRARRRAKEEALNALRRH